MGNNYNLKPCPFCGKDLAVIFKEPTYLEGRINGYQYQIVCDFQNEGCGASSGYYDMIAEAKEAWNRRANGPECIVDEEKPKLSCHFEYCINCASLIRHTIPGEAGFSEVRCGRKHRGIPLRGAKPSLINLITPEDFDNAPAEE